MRGRIDGALGNQFVRYIANGLVATAVHFSALTFNLKTLHISSAGVANGIAAILGITVSFIGSRYFVFRGTQGHIGKQSALFVVVYACIAVLHALILYAWTDRMGWDYRAGFVLATGMQMAFSFFANKFVVFK